MGIATLFWSQQFRFSLQRVGHLHQTVARNIWDCHSGAGPPSCNSSWPGGASTKACAVAASCNSHSSSLLAAFRNLGGSERLREKLDELSMATSWEPAAGACSRRTTWLAPMDSGRVTAPGRLTSCNQWGSYYMSDTKACEASMGVDPCTLPLPSWMRGCHASRYFIFCNPLLQPPRQSLSVTAPSVC